MPRQDLDLTRKCQPIKGGPFQIRVWTSGQFSGGRPGPRTRLLDKLVTVTLPAIDGEKIRIIPTVEIAL